MSYDLQVMSPSGERTQAGTPATREGSQVTTAEQFAATREGLQNALTADGAPTSAASAAAV